MKRLMYCPPWKLTHWGWGFSPKPQRGCDEWHNRSWYVVTPLGMWAVFPFYDEWYDRVEGEEHLYGKGPLGYDGEIVGGCVVCAEILEAFDR